MKRNIFIGIGIFILVIIIFVIAIFVGDNASSYEFNENINEHDLLTFNTDGKEVEVCENCTYTADSGEYVNAFMYYTDISSGEIEYKQKEEYDVVIANTTGVGVKIRDNYKKVIARYALTDDKAYWNLEYDDDKLVLSRHPSDLLDDNDLLNGYLTFVYYKDNGKWKLLDVDKYYKNGSMIIDGYDEYIYYSFYVVFNGSSKYTKNDRVESMTIYHYKNV